MTINWEIYDNINRFTLFKAACLWAEIDPCKDIPSEQLEIVEMMLVMLRVESFPFLKDQATLIAPDSLRDLNKEFRKRFEQLVITRSELEEIARNVDQKPKFLFPEERSKNNEGNHQSNLPFSPPNGKERNTYLKILAGLLLAQGYKIPYERGDAKRLESLLQLNLKKEVPTDETILNILRKIKNLDYFSEKPKSNN